MHKLTAEGLYKQYGQRDVVRDVSLALQQGEVVGLLGPNGAGKTTTFYMLVGIIRPTMGRVYVDDTEITGWPLHERDRQRMS